jgi:hypothetical protein
MKIDYLAVNLKKIAILYLFQISLNFKLNVSLLSVCRCKIQQYEQTTSFKEKMKPFCKVNNIEIIEAF